MCINFWRWTSSNIEKMNLFFFCSSGTSFCNITWYRDTCPLNLISESKHFCLRKRLKNLINLWYKFNTSLPNMQFFMIHHILLMGIINFIWCSVFFFFYYLTILPTYYPTTLHKMYVFFDKPSNVRFHPSVFERFWSEPLISNKPFFFPGPRLWFTGIFYEKEWNFFVDHWRSFEIGCRERIVDCIHKFDDTEIRFCKSCFFRNLTKRCFHWGFIIFNMSFGENIFEFITSIFPCKHKNLYVRSFFSIHDATSTLFMEFCLGHRYK